MTSKKLISRIFLISLFLLGGALPAQMVQAEAATLPFYTGGNSIWARQMGGTSFDAGHSVALDQSGNVYMTGIFQGTVDFNPGPGIFNLTSTGGLDTVISKLNSNGDFIWAKRIGGTDRAIARELSIASDNSIYVAGYFGGTVDFNPGAGINNLTSAGGFDIFVMKLDSNGNFVWAKPMGGVGEDTALRMTLDLSDNVYTTGSFRGTSDFDPSPAVANLTSSGPSMDIFVSQLDRNGNFVWAKRIGGTETDEGYGIAVDTNGSVYTTGYFGGTADFDPGVGVYNLVNVENLDAFIFKLDSNGNFIWAKNMEAATGVSSSQGRDIATGPGDTVYMTGSFGGTVDFDPGPGVYNLTSVGLRSDVFVSKLDAHGNFLWAKVMGGTETDDSYAIAVDASGSAYITGYFEATGDLDPGMDVYSLTSAGLSDVFVSKLRNNGKFAWAKRIGGTGYDEGRDVIIDVDGNLQVTGIFQLTADFGSSTGNLLSAGGSDIFITKLEYGKVFEDMHLNYWALNFIEQLYFAGITGGCNTDPLEYCPESTVTRAQMAVFLLKGIHGSSYAPPVVGSSTGFSDVQPTHWAAKWIKQLAVEKITGGCATGKYCPEGAVTRAQMAIFLLKAKHGASYSPPAVGSSTGFGDVDTEHWAAKWIKQLEAEGITGGCGNGNYCPDTPVTRAQMAVFLVKTFNLP